MGKYNSLQTNKKSSYDINNSFTVLITMLTKKRADRVLLYNIDWEQCENILVDLGQTRSARIAYDNGTLEIMSPLSEHEYYKENIGTAIQDIAEKGF
jgi:Uma2 family endonuclease